MERYHIYCSFPNAEKRHHHSPGVEIREDISSEKGSAAYQTVFCLVDYDIRNDVAKHSLVGDTTSVVHSRPLDSVR